jgi:hypothetical protein
MIAWRLAADPARAARRLVESQGGRVANFSDAQAVVVRARVAADPVLAAIPAGADGAVALAAAVNGQVAPAAWIWRDRVDAAELTNVLDYKHLLSRLAGERETFAIMLLAGSITPSLATTRAALADIFSGPQAEAVAQRAALLAVCRRRVLIVEAWLAAGGAGTVADPYTAGLVGPVTPAAVAAAMGW